MTHKFMVPKRKFTEHGFGRCLSKADFYISTESTAYAVYAPESSNVSNFIVATHTISTFNSRA